VLTRFRDTTCRWCGRLMRGACPRADGMGRLGGKDGLVGETERGFEMSFPRLG
jgi:hypothetical protein